MNAAASPPLVCELLLEHLADAVTAFRTWIDTVGHLTAEALVSSGTIESCDELFDRRRWDTGVGTGGPPRPRFRRLSARSWAAITTTDDFDVLHVTLHPLPHVPEHPGNASNIWLDSTLAMPPGIPNRVTCVLPARYCTHITTEWTQRLVDAFKALGSAAGAQTGYIEWTTPMKHMRHPLGVIDYTTTVMQPGWAVLLRDGHVDRVGGLAAIRSSGLFAAVESLTTQSGESLYYLQTSRELSPSGGTDQYRDNARFTEFLRPVLLP